jgi:hypothetical protein
MASFFQRGVDNSKVLPTIDTASGAADTAVEITLAAVPAHRHYVVQVIWAYSDTPTGGSLTISGLDSDDIVLAVASGGPGSITLPPAPGGLNEAVVITLAAAGGSVTGQLSVISTLLRGW